MSNNDNGGPIKVTVTKETRDTKVGVSFRQDSDEDILIHTISPNGLFANTRLQPGMEVLRVNGVDVDCLGLSAVMKLLKEAPDVVSIEALAIHKPEDSTKRRSSSTIMAEPAVATATRRPVDPDARNSSNNREPEIIVASAAAVAVPAAAATSIAMNGNSTVTPVIANTSGGDPDAIPVASAQVLANSFRTTPSTPIITMEATQVSPSPSSDGAVVKSDMVNPDGSVTVVATKPSPDAKTGVGLANRNGVGVVITSIKTFSIFTGTNLRQGMKILQVNGTNVQHESAEHIAMLLQSIVGDVTLVATNLYNEVGGGSTPVAQAQFQLTTVVVTKPYQEAKVGLGITNKRSPYGTEVPYISNIAADGPCAGTALRVGMRMLSINGIGCRGQHDTIAMLRMAPAGPLTLVAGPMNMLTANVTKATRETKVGLTMQRRNGMLVVTNLPPAGLFAKTELQVGMRVLQINGVNVDALDDTTQVLQIIASAEGNVCVVAEHVQQPTTATTPAGPDPNAPPPGAPAGGEWGVGNYFGPTMGLWYCICCICCGLCGLFTLCCKADKAAMYRAPNGTIYNTKGVNMGNEANVKFRHNPPGVQGPQNIPESDIEKSCGPNAATKLVVIGTVVSVALTIIYLVMGVFREQEDTSTYYSRSCGYKYCYEWDTCYNSYTNQWESCYERNYVYRCGSC